MSGAGITVGGPCPPALIRLEVRMYYSKIRSAVSLVTTRVIREHVWVREIFTAPELT